MLLRTAKQVGQRAGIQSAFIGLVIAYLIMAILMIIFDKSIVKGLLWITDVYWWYNVVIGAVGLLIMGYLFGGLAGVEILTKKKNENQVGKKYGILTLMTAAIIGSSVGFQQEGLNNIGSGDNPFEDYYFKPLFWVTLLGIIPTVFVGEWSGRQIKKKGIKKKTD